MRSNPTWAFSLAACAMASVLSACGATQAQKRASIIATEARSAEAEAMACRTAVLSMPAFLSLADRIPLKGVPTQVQIADTRIVEPPEREVTALVFDALTRCRDAYAARVAAVAPSMLDPIQTAYLQADLVRARLIDGGMTWGRYHREMAEIEMASRANIRTAGAVMDQQVNAEHAVEMQSRAAVAGAFGAALAPRPYIYGPVYVVRRR